MLEEFIELHMKEGRLLVPARLQSALALLEKVRESPDLVIENHLASKGSSGLRGHETFGRLAHERLGIEPISVTHGRRSSHLQAWGQILLDLLNRNGFSESRKVRQALLEQGQRELGAALQSLLDDQPLEARLQGRSIEAVVQSILEQADRKGKIGDVAQYLVGAKLEQRLGREIAIHGVNLADRHPLRTGGQGYGDFEIEDCIIEVAMGYPDKKHLLQISAAADSSGKEMWLLTRTDRVDSWRNEITELGSAVVRRTVVAAVESFVGQNITEMGAFSSSGKTQQFESLIDRYNSRWIAAVGANGLMISVR